MENGTERESNKNRGRCLSMLFKPKHCVIVGEVAQAHDGSLGAAHAYIDAVARSAADAVKFQTHIAAAESMPCEPWRIRFSPQDESRYDYWKRMEFTEEQWLGLKHHAEEKNLEFISSPFSIEAARMLKRIGVATWKVASGEANNPQLLEFVIATRLPVILSTGMSKIEEVDAIVARLQAAEVPIAVMQCTSMYPCPPENIGLNMLPYYKRRYKCAVGLSDHSGSIFPSLAAVSIGAEVLEVHVTLSRECFGPDVVASVTTSELTTMVEGVRFIEKMRSHEVVKDEMAEKLKPIRELFTKSIVAKLDLGSGTSLTADCLTVKKPGTGIPADQLPSIIGRRIRRSVAAGEMLSATDLIEDDVADCSHRQ